MRLNPTTPSLNWNPQCFPDWESLDCPDRCTPSWMLCISNKLMTSFILFKTFVYF